MIGYWLCGAAGLLVGWLCGWMIGRKALGIDVSREIDQITKDIRGFIARRSAEGDADGEQ